MGEFLPVLSKAEARESDQGLKVAAAAAATVAATMGVKKPSQFVEEFVAAASADGLTPVIIIDEASIAFPDGNGGNGVRRLQRKLPSPSSWLSASSRGRCPRHVGVKAWL